MPKEHKQKEIRQRNKTSLSIYIKNYNELRENIKPMGYNEARRMRGPIYDVLLTELYESQCYRIIKIFHCMLKKEEELLGHEIIYRLSDNKPLLIKLVDNVRQADIILRTNQCGNIKKAFKLLYNCIELLEENMGNYEWILGEFFEIVNQCLVQLQQDQIAIDEVKSLFLYKYAMFMQKRKKTMKAISLLDEALLVCRGSDILYKDTDQYLHNVIVHDAARVVLNHAESLHSFSPVTAQSFTMKALRILAEVGLETERELLFRALSLEMKCLIVLKKFYDVEQKIKKFHQKYQLTNMTPDIAKQLAIIYGQEAICKFNLNKYTETIEVLVKAFEVTRKYNLKENEGDLWVWAGKTFALNEQKRDSARIAFMAAKLNYTNYGKNSEKALMSDFRLGDMKSVTVMTYLIRNIKAEEYCTNFHLRQWKNQCKPFWFDLAPNKQLIQDLDIESINPVEFLQQNNNFSMDNNDNQDVGEIIWIDGDAIQDNERNANNHHNIKCLLDEYPTARFSIEQRKSLLEKRKKELKNQLETDKRMTTADI